MRASDILAHANLNYAHVLYLQVYCLLCTRYSQAEILNFPEDQESQCID